MGLHLISSRRSIIDDIKTIRLDAPSQIARPALNRFYLNIVQFPARFDFQSSSIDRTARFSSLEIVICSLFSLSFPSISLSLFPFSFFSRACPTTFFCFSKKEGLNCRDANSFSHGSGEATSRNDNATWRIIPTFSGCYLSNVTRLRNSLLQAQFVLEG